MLKWKRFNINLSPLRITIFYACIGATWLFLISARLIEAMFLNPAATRTLEINSTLFILATSWILYYLIRKSESGILTRKAGLTRVNRSLKAYSECHQALIRATNETELMQNICRIIVEVGGYKMAWVGLADNDADKKIRPIVQWGDREGYLDNLNVSWSDTDYGQGPTGTAVKSGKPVVIQYIEYDPKWELWRANALKHGFLSSISLPLFHEEKVFAALVIFSEEANSIDSDEVKLLSELTGDLSFGISALRVAAENRRVEKERMLLSSVIEQAKEGIILFDGEGVIQYVNQAVETITGRNSVEMTGQNIHLLKSQGGNEKFYDSILNSITSSEEGSGQFLYRRDDDVIFELNVTTWPVSDSSGRVISHAALLRDVTLEIQLEKQMRHGQRMESIGTLAGGIAHDFNNALSSIITCSELALDDIPKESPLRELLDVILKSSLRGKNLVKQILTFSRQGEQERQEVRVDLIAGECLKLLRASVPASIDLSLNLGRDLGRVFADPTQIHQVAMNLCTNAVHAMHGMPRGMLEIWLDNVDLDRYSIIGSGNLPPGRYLRLKVKDNGHGMDRLTMERIFDPFFSTKGQAEGTGLGLSVIHGIVKNNGGAITVESKPGAGATFSVYLPRIDAMNGGEPDICQTEISRGSERILLVDDEEDLLLATERMLGQLGYSVVASAIPAQALEIFCAGPESFDLIITDQSMPGMSGIELAREIARLRGGIPIILCTGYDPMSSGAASCSGEPAEFITELALKPLERGEIASLIRRVLDETETTPENTEFRSQNSEEAR